ncbi:MAG: hypothetical protein Q8L48_21050 [Archangium sp.]|nr:hypothetical protein [Archangium sp.]
MRHAFLVCGLLLLACGPKPEPQPGVDGGADAGVEVDAGTDAGADAGVVQIPDIAVDRSLFWGNDAGVVDDAQVISFAKLMAVAAGDGHGGALLSQWFHRFATTAHSERALPAQFIDAVIAQQGADPTQWDLSLLPFKVTGIHNRIDLAKLVPGGHCGELRASVSSSDLTLQPFHALFLFNQPLGEGDVVNGQVTCEGTARRWAALSGLQGAAFEAALRTTIAEGFTHERFALLETVEFTLAPWEWRQWVPAADGGVENPPMFQQLDVERLNAPGALRDDFLAWVDANAAQLAQRRVLFPDRFRAQSIRVTQGIPRVPLSLAGAASAASFPTLRQELEVVGCAACHTADAEFVQTRSDRSVSPFYEKELRARAVHLAAMARGNAPAPPFGPLQPDPVLPP